MRNPHLALSLSLATMIGCTSGKDHEHESQKFAGIAYGGSGYGSGSGSGSGIPEDAAIVVLEDAGWGSGSGSGSGSGTPADADVVVIEDAGWGSGSGSGSDAGSGSGTPADAAVVVIEDAGSGSGSGSGSDAAIDAPADAPYVSYDAPMDADCGSGDGSGCSAPPDAPPPPPDAPPPPPPKPRVVKCQGDVKTVAHIKGTSGQHHVDASNKHVTDYAFRVDTIESCNRNWCKDNDPVGVFFTHHGGKGDVEWKTTCKPSGVPDKPCVAEITESTPKLTQKFEDHNGDAQHWHTDSPHWPHWEHNHTCAFSGEVPNIQVQKYCNTSVVINSNVRQNYIAYGILFSANHSSDIPVGVSLGVVAGPAFGAASYTPTHGTGTYGSSRGYETAMGCKKVGEKELDTMIVEFWEPVVIETKKHSAESSNENGTFPDPVVE